MLKVKFLRWDTYVLMKVLEQDEDTRDKLDFRAKNGFYIESHDIPHIFGDRIDVRGCNRDGDSWLDSYDYDTAEQAKAFVYRAKEAIAEYNVTHCGKKPDEPYDVEITIAE